MNHANPLSEIGLAAAEAAGRATQISMDSVERALAVQLAYAHCVLKRGAANAHAATQTRDAQELVALRSGMAEAALEGLIGYSRSLYEVASETQSEYSRLAEERMAHFQRAIAQTVDQAAKSVPGGSDVVVAAIKSQLAATTAAFDSFTKAARNLASYADAVSASRPAQRRS